MFGFAPLCLTCLAFLFVLVLSKLGLFHTGWILCCSCVAMYGIAFSPWISIGACVLVFVVFGREPVDQPWFIVR